MVAIIVGGGLGLERSSVNLLGGRGQVGDAAMGRAGLGAYVNAKTGDLILDAGGEMLIGRGPDTAINRTYNSLGLMDDDNGDNWASVVSQVRNMLGTYGTAGSTVDRLGWDGSVVTYSYNSVLGAYVAKQDDGALDTITSATGPWTWTDGRTGVTEVYTVVSGTQKVTQRKDRDGNTITYSYTGSLLTRVTMADGSYSDLVYSGNNLASITTSYTAIDPDTRVESAKTLTRVRYGYDASNRLTSVTVDLSPEDGSIADGRTYVTTYTYDGSSKRVASIAQTDGSLLTLTYDTSGRVATFTQTVDASTTRTTGFTYGAGSTTITDPLGQATVLYYDAQGRLTRKDEPAPLVGGNPIVTTIDYDSSDNAWRIMRFDGTANIGNTGHAIEYRASSFDGRGNVVETTDGAGGITTYTYNSFNQVLTETHYSGVDTDGLGGTTPSGAMTTRYAYDALGHLRFVMSAEGRVTEYRYDGFGQQVSTIDYSAHTMTNTSLTEADGISWVASLADKSTTLRTDTSYDFRGNIAMVTSFSKCDVMGNGIRAADFTQSLYVYDQAGRLLSRQVSSGGQVVTANGLSSWGASNLSTAATGTLLGQPANQYTIQTTGWAALNAGLNANAGDVFTVSMTLQGVGSVTQATLGLYGSTSSWGDWGVSSARIVSGPGQLVRADGGLWRVTGLSTTQATRVEVTRRYKITEGGGAYLYPNDLAGQPAGSSILVADPVLVREAPALETYAYDGLGRTIRFTDAKGAGTWTTYLDAQARTVVTLANGLTRTSAFNKAGEQIAVIEARADGATANLQPNQADWGYGGVARTSAGKIDGADAYKYTVQTTGGWSGMSSGFNARAGDTVTWAVSLQAVAGSATTQSLGIYGNSSGWGLRNTGSARIVSGPGSLSQNAGHYWTVSGLSATEPTRIEITRDFVQDESGGGYLYVDDPSGYRAGQSLIAAAPSLTVGRHTDPQYGDGFNPAQFDINQWGLGNLDRQAGFALSDGHAASKLSTIQVGQWTATSTGVAARAGDVVTARMSIQAVAGSPDSISLGVHYHLPSDSPSGWGADENSYARIISGPGTLRREVGGLWSILGLSSTQATRIEIVRVSVKDEGGGVYLYVDPTASGNAVLVGGPSITKTQGRQTSYHYDAAGRLRIRQDPLGARTFYFYDRAGRLAGEVDGSGSVTEYKRDAAGRTIASVAYAGQLGASQIASLYDGAGNPTSIVFDSIRPAATSADRWNWSIYDRAGRVIETIDAIGAATAYQYDGAGRLIKTTKYNAPLTQTAGATILETYKATPPTGFVQPGWDQSVDRSIRYFYDNDGLLIGTLDEDAYITEYFYDKAGRKIETARYANQGSTAYLPSGAFNQLTPGTFANVKASILPASSDIHEYWLYDGRGRLGAEIDGEGNVTRYHYTPRGDVDQEVRGQQVTAATAYTLASLPAAGGTFEVTNYVRDAVGNMLSRVRQLSGGQTETTLFTYDSLGNLLTETTSETVSSETRTQTFRYDAEGRLTGSLQGVGSAALAALGANPTQTQIDTIYNTYGTRYRYDAADRLIEKTAPGGTGGTGNRTVYYYDANGNLRYEVNALGEVKQYSYNAFDQQNAAYVYGTRLSPATVTGLTGGLVTSTISNAIAAIASTVLDTHTETSYTNRGEVKLEYDPLYWADPAVMHYAASYYNSFGDIVELDRPTGASAAFWDTSTFGYYRRGLSYYKSTLRDSSSSGALQNTFTYDGFGRVTIAYSNNTDWRWQLDRTIEDLAADQ